MSSRGETFVCGFKNSSLGETTQRQVCVDRGERENPPNGRAGRNHEEPVKESEEEGSVGGQPGPGYALSAHSPSLAS